jgi:aminoglycoside phosphotransferase (APT) family kinase protein
MALTEQEKESQKAQKANEDAAKAAEKDAAELESAANTKAVEDFYAGNPSNAFIYQTEGNRLVARKR